MNLFCFIQKKKTFLGGPSFSKSQQKKMLKKVPKKDIIHFFWQNTKILLDFGFHAKNRENCLKNEDVNPPLYFSKISMFHNLMTEMTTFNGVSSLHFSSSFHDFFWEAKMYNTCDF